MSAERVTIRLQRPGKEEDSWRKCTGEFCGVPFVIQLDLNQPTSRYIHDCLVATGCYEEESTSAIIDALTPGDVFFDVGANVGWFSVIASACGARVVAFEPMHTNCHALLLNAPSATVVRAAVSDMDGQVSIYVNLDNDGGHALWPVGNHSHNTDTAKANHPRARVQSVRLDDYADYKPAVIKIDTEGAECNVLRGAEKVLSQPTLRMVVCERNRTGLAYLQHSPEEVEEIMRGHGFTWAEPDGSIVDNWIFRR